jgi:LAO/AO transport system kinase
MIRLSPEYYIQGVLNRDRRLMAKTITLVESTLPTHQEMARKVLDALLPHAGKAIRLGITGIPGAGKSTFIENFGAMLTQENHYVAVLAVDPSSPKTGGSIMADKTRMERLSSNERVFIRPSPSGGTLGGVARKTRETMLVCEAAGYDFVIVETVGVGQSEVTVASMVDFFLVLIIAGAGDEIQRIKKGILELADAIVVNKADGENVERAEITRQQCEMIFHMVSPPSQHWTPPVLTCSSVTMNGMEKIRDVVFEHHQKFTASGELKRKRREQNREWMCFLVREGLEDWFYGNEEVKHLLHRFMREVEQGNIIPTSAASQILLYLKDCKFLI